MDKALLIVLLHMRTRVRNRRGLSPFEILVGRPLNTGIGPVKRQLPDSRQCEDKMLLYCYLASVLSDNHRQAKEALPKTMEKKWHDLKLWD